MSTTFQVGDRVRIPLGRRSITGVIIEDRGAIGVRGRHLYQVRVPMDPFDPTTYEVAEDEIEPFEEPVDGGVPTKDQIIDYLVCGGLIAILSANLVGGRNQPRVWLRPDSLGNVTYTFDEERGVVGGATIPSFAVRDDKVFRPKRDEILSFLTTFGLDRPEAEKVVSEVGTAP